MIDTATIIIGFVLAILLIALVAALTFYLGFVYRDRHKNHKAQFIADMYKLQQKWAKRGQMEYSEGIGLIIRAQMIDEEEMPQTEYGKTLAKNLINNNE